ncbi:MAG: hypothetical protein WKF83_13945 [Nocardioidaceae bacterium]
MRSSEEEWQDFAARLRYVPRTAGRRALAAAVAEAEAELDGEPRRLHYLSVPPARRPAGRCTCWPKPASSKRSRIVMEKPFGTDLDAAKSLNAELHEVVRREPDLPHRPLPGQGGGAEHPRLPLRQRPLRADLEPQPHRPRADRRPRDARPRRAQRVLRGDRRLHATWW